MERLRYIARSPDVGQQVLIEEAATALASLADDHHQLVMACRQMISHHPSSGAVVALAARLLTAPDPRQEAWSVVDQVRSDLTTEHLIDALASSTKIRVAGWSEHVDSAMIQRPDLSLVASSAEADVVLIEAVAADPSRLLIGDDVEQVLAEATRNDVAAWAIVSFGAILPASLFDAVTARSGDGFVVVELSAVSQVICNEGAIEVTAGPLLSDCPYAAELA